MKKSIAIVTSVFLIIIAGCSSSDTKMENKPAKTAPYPGELTVNQEVKTASGVKYIDMKEGDGDTPKRGRRIKVHYTGYLMDGTTFDTSRDDNEPLSFILGAGQVIDGWEEGISTMKIGGKRKLIVPPELGYGAEGYPELIPGNSVIVFDVELLDVQ